MRRMTNREYVNSLSDEEFAKLMLNYDCPPDCCDRDSTVDCCVQTSCEDCWVRWLKLEKETSK
jgi:hypothetical protein